MAFCCSCAVSRAPREVKSAPDSGAKHEIRTWAESSKHQARPSDMSRDFLGPVIVSPLFPGQYLHMRDKGLHGQQMALFPSLHLPKTTTIPGGWTSSFLKSVCLFHLAPCPRPIPSPWIRITAWWPGLSQCFWNYLWWGTISCSFLVSHQSQTDTFIKYKKEEFVGKTIMYI